MKKRVIIIGIIVVVIIVAVVLFFVMQKPAATPAAVTTSSTTPTTVSDNGITKTVNTSTLGNYLTNENDMALYTYSSDTSGISNCTGTCVANWPVYMDDSEITTGLPTDIGTITRTDTGIIQYTYKGLPLYTFTSDPSGQVTGNGVAGFKLATP
jgi:predicted lipoprotein with Yx(FWY)xxD motif